MQKAELESAVEELCLVRLKEVVDKHLYPLVKCPFGCSEYFHNTGKVPYDVIIAHMIGPEWISMKSGKCQLEFDCGIQNDFL